MKTTIVFQFLWVILLWIVWQKLNKEQDTLLHGDVIKWKHFPRYRPFVRWIHGSPHKGQWRGALIFSLICARINSWVTIARLVIWDAIAPIMTSLTVWYWLQLVTHALISQIGIFNISMPHISFNFPTITWVFLILSCYTYRSWRGNYFAR